LQESNTAKAVFPSFDGFLVSQATFPFQPIITRNTGSISYISDTNTVSISLEHILGTLYRSQIKVLRPQLKEAEMNNMEIHTGGDISIRNFIFGYRRKIRDFFFLISVTDFTA